MKMQLQQVAGEKFTFVAVYDPATSLGRETSAAHDAGDLIASEVTVTMDNNAKNTFGVGDYYEIKIEKIEVSDKATTEQERRFTAGQQETGNDSRSTAERRNDNSPPREPTLAEQARPAPYGPSQAQRRSGETTNPNRPVV